MRLFFNGAHANGAGNRAEVSQAAFTRETSIDEVASDPAFGNWGRLLFPVQRGYMTGSTLGSLGLSWYNYIDPDMTVEVCNYLRNRAVAGETSFIDIYTDEEKAADPAKADTGLVFFRGDAGGRTAIVNAGGGFAYVGAMHDSFPHCLELSKRGYNAFALIYRPSAQTACEDLARAIAYLHEHADELGISMDGYSLWGGSAGARMAAWLGMYGAENFGAPACPRPAACIVNYTGLSGTTGTEPPTYSAVGTSDWIADWRTMQSRIDRIRANGTSAEIEVFDGLLHGFGLGTGTAAEGWLDRAVAFWEQQLS
ncbi:MAG: alpha/beta hydrolase [Coriobacteriia bacterium]|nr:alpha/beta hydrolase [Coriobacteriia bacterium]